MKLVIVCGLPGSGKTTLARKLETDLPAIRFCPDEWMDDLSINLYDEKTRAAIEALQWKLGQSLLQQGVTVIIEWGTWGRSERDLLRVRARELGASADLYYLSAPAEMLYSRISKRGMESPPITREAVDRWCVTFQVPSAEEMALFDHVTTIQAERE